jgi:GAF domain-containing protein
LGYKLLTLNEVTKQVPKISDLKEVFSFVLQRAVRTLESKTDSIMLLDEETNTLRIVSFEWLDPSIASDTLVSVGEGIARMVAQTGMAVVVDDIEKDARFARLNDQKYDAGSFVSMPTHVEGRVIEVLNLTSKQHAWACQ